MVIKSWKGKEFSRIIIKPRLRPKPWSFKEHLSAKEKGRKKTKETREKQGGTKEKSRKTKRKIKDKANSR